MNNDRASLHATDTAAETARFMSRVYAWMTGGILLTAVVSMMVAGNEELLRTIVTNKPIFWGLIIAQLGAVLCLSLLMPKINALTAALIYLVYAALTGMTLSVIFILYTQQSIFQVFAITAAGFAGLSGFGLVTKRDLGPIGSFCTMGLFGLIGWGLLSMFFPSMMGGALSPTYSIIGLIVFSGLTAYDTQKIKTMNIIGNEGTDEDRKEAIYGALTLYLDFVNLFLNLLRLMGKRR